ncbi:MAG: acyl-CoA dehydrogenase family protein [Thermoanaerobaculia bacterium]|nr:acyl-CoA dehydrogenase family protein [Thermoanaerobaculia bacterium]
MAEIEFGPEQAMLADIASRFFAERHPVSAARDQLLTASGYDPEVWSEMVEAGWLDLVVPEAYGGAGLGMTELVSVVEPMGRRLFASPFVTTQLAIQALLRAGDGAEALRREWLPRLCRGAAATVALVEAGGDWAPERLASSVSPEEPARLEVEKRFVLDADAADLVVVSLRRGDEPCLAFVERSRLPAGALEREIVIDETRRSYRLSLSGVEVDPACLVTGEDASTALRAVRDAGLLLVSAEACGGIAGALDVIVDYLRSRVQFGRPIGSYQALKHPAVDILVGLERSRSHLYHAATVFGGEGAESALRMLKAEAGETFAFAGDRAVQFHGGLGFTYECDAQLYLRRALWCQYQFGDALHQRRHLADLLL